MRGQLILLRMWQKLLGIVLLTCAAGAFAGGDVLVDKAWLRESVPGQTAASLQLNLTVTRPARLARVSSPWAEAVEIQRLSPGKGGVAAHALPNVRLSRNRTLAFGERRMALMMLGLKRPLNVGDSVPVSLTLEFANKPPRVVEVRAEVLPLDLSYKHYKRREVHDHK